MISLKTIKGRHTEHIVTVDGKERVFGMMIWALEYIYEIQSRKTRLQFECNESL